VVGDLSLLAAAAAILPYRMDPGARLGRHLMAGALAIAALSVVEILVALIPLRRGERWAFWASAVPVAVVGVPLVMVDAIYVPAGRILGALVPQVLGLAVMVAGLTLCGLSLFGSRAPNSPRAPAS
jgi:hypothetical protein